MVGHPLYTSRPPGFGGAGEEDFYGFYTGCAVDYSEPPENNGIFLFSYRSGDIIREPKNTFWELDSFISTQINTIFQETEDGMYFLNINGIGEAILY
ncbi:MAG: hypothetical protein ACP5G4_03675, partial [bacterium]